MSTDQIIVELYALQRIIGRVISDYNASIATPVQPPATPNGVLTLSAPNSPASGVIAFTGSVTGDFIFIELWDGQGVSQLGAAQPDASGNFSISVDTTKMFDGQTYFTIYAYDALEGQPFGDMTFKTVLLNLSNNNPAPAN